MFFCLIAVAVVSLAGMGSIGGINMASAKNTHHYFGQTKDSYQSEIDYGNNIAIGHYVKSTDDTKIYYEAYGEGKPVVLLHGGLVGSPNEMGQLADKLLKENRQVILIATRGHARSYMGNKVPSYEQKADDVNAVLADLKIDKVDLIGFSDGAYTAYFFDKAYPDKVNALVVIGAGVWKRGFVQGGRVGMNSFADLKSFDEQYWKEQLTGIRPETNCTDEWFNSVMDYYNSVEVGQEVFKKVNAKTFVIAGEKDMNAPLNTVIEAYHLLPNAHLAIIPNAPHPILMTDFDLVWNMIDKFLN